MPLIDPLAGEPKRRRRKTGRVLLVLVALCAPLIVAVLGHPPLEFHYEKIDPNLQVPSGRFGGIDREFLFGAEPAKRRDDYATVVTIALLLMLRSLAVAIGGPNQFRPETNLPIMWVGPLPMEGARVAASVLALVALALFYVVISRTWVGLALRAMAQNRVAAQTSGVDVFRLDAMAFAIGVALAGLAGALLAPLFLVYPTNGAVTTVKGFEIIVIGGLGSIPGALIGGLLLGVVESLGAAFISSPYQNAYGFLLVILVLLVRPHGLFGERGREA